MKIIVVAIAFLMNYGPFMIYMLSVPRILHMMQLEGYQNTDFIRWMMKNPKKAFQKELPQLIVVALEYLVAMGINYTMITKLSLRNASVMLALECVLLSFTEIILNGIKARKSQKERKEAKKKLVYTARAKRLLFWNAITVLFLEVFFLYPYYQSTVSFYLIKPLAYSLFTFQLPINMIIANFFASPTENLIKDKYIRKAKKKLCRKEYKDLIKIGITGSYGKTSTKFILATILSEKYKVLATPESYNTTYGNIKTIREELKPEHQIFISEMGARYRNEITEIASFVNPQIGMITSIGEQHLESFKTIENVVKAKSELLKALPADGIVVLPDDNAYCLELYQKEKRKKFLYALNHTKSDVYAKNIEVSKDGCSFVAVTPIGKIQCQCVLLGEHQVQNILGAITVAVYLGLTKEEIERGIAKIQPIEHRLQLIDKKNGILVIDDAFNSNPVGSKEALKTLQQFAGRKIIVTPGMVELGEKEESLNYELGKEIAKVVNIAILIGAKRSQAMVKGMTEKGFPEENLFVVESLQEATKKLGEISQTGDIILFENDLPDNYNES